MSGDREQLIDAIVADVIDHMPWVRDRNVAGWASPVLDALDRLGYEVAPKNRVLDEHDAALYAEAFTLAEASRRFLCRVSTLRVIGAGLLDEDVLQPLIESADRAWLIGVQRVQAARAEAVRSAEDGT